MSEKRIIKYRCGYVIAICFTISVNNSFSNYSHKQVNAFIHSVFWQ